MDIKQKYRHIWKDLYSSETGLLAYTLHRRYHLQPSEAVAFMDQYEKEGLITVDNELRISITNKGRESIGDLLQKLVNASSDEGSLYLDNIKVNDKVGIFEPYIPDKQFYFKYKNEGSNKETSK